MSLPGSPSSPSLYWNLRQRVEHGKLSPFEFWQWRLMTFDRCYNQSAILRNPRYASGWWKYWEIQRSKTRLSTHLPVRIMKGKVGYSIICVQRQRTGSGAIWYNFFRSLIVFLMLTICQKASAWQVYLKKGNIAKGRVFQVEIGDPPLENKR